MAIKLVGSKQVRMEDFSDFDVETDFELVDILNDGLYENTKHTFVTAPGSFLYEFTLNVNMKKAAELGISSVNIEIYDKKPVISKIKNNDPRDRIRENKNDFEVRREVIGESNFDPIAKSQLELGINNYLMSSAKSASTTADFIFDESLRLSEPVICENDSYSNPVILNPSNSARLFISNSDAELSIAQIKRRNLRIFGIDPGKTNDQSRALYQTFASNINSSISNNLQDGSTVLPVSLNATNFQKNYISLRSLRNNLRKKVIANNFASKAVQLAANANVVSTLKKDYLKKLSNGSTEISENAQAIIAHEVVVRSHFKTFKAIVEVPKKNINFIYVKLQPIFLKKTANSKSIPTFYMIDHGQKLDQIMIPAFAPKLQKIRDERGLISFDVKQVDPSSTSIIIMRKIFGKDFDDDGNFEIISEKQVEYHDPSFIFVDNNVTNYHPNIVVYRVASKYGNLLGPFESLTFQGHSTAFIPNVNFEPDNLSIIALNESNGIKIEIGKIPERAITLRLYREDMMQAGSKFDRNTIIRNEKNETSTMLSGDRELTFYDRNASYGRKYRYYCVLTMRGGTQITTTEDEIIVRDFSTSDIPIYANISDAEIQESSENISAVKMKLSVVFKDDAYQFIRNLLKEQGVENSYLEEFDKNRDEIKNAVLFRAERIDRATGRRLSLGTVVPGEFVDDSVRANNLSISTVEPGKSYIYKFRMCLIPPSAFLSNVFESASSGKKPGFKDYQFQANKYNNPVLKNKGILPSTVQLNRGFDPNLLAIQADTGYSVQQEINIPIKKSVPANVRVKSISNGTTLITWQLTSGNKVVEEFNVRAYLNGRYELLPTVACGQTGNFYCIDDKFNKELGTIIYSISAVYSDGTESPFSDSNPITRMVDNATIARKIENQNSKILGKSNLRNEYPNQILTIKEFVAKMKKVSLK